MPKRPPAPARYENSPMDVAEDRRGAGLLGITQQQYEQLPVDRMQDMRGQQRLAAAHVVKQAANAYAKIHQGGARKKR